jgi:prepilin peptidase CpaA
MTGDTAASGWQTGVGAVLIVLLTIALVSDWRQRRIPNVLVLVTLLAGIVFHTLGPQSSGTGGLFSTQPGALGAWRALAGAAVGLVLFLPFYVLRLLGAGDVKLIIACNLFLGLPSGIVMIGMMLIILVGIATYLAIRRRSMKTPIPLGPVIAAAAAIANIPNMIRVL